MEKETQSGPSVDILIITYNQDRYIDETIRSVVNQTYKHIKIIIADDYSTDKTRQIIEKWYQQYPELIIKCFNEVNLGITGNSNSGLSKCNGDYLVYMGGDDVLYANKIEKQLAFFTKNPEMSLCGHQLDLIDENSKFIGRFLTNRITSGVGAFNWISKGMLYGCLSIMIKRDKNRSILFDRRLFYSSDLKFFIDFLSDDAHYGSIETSLGAYRKHAASITTSKWEECVADSETMFYILKKEKSKVFARAIKKGENYQINYGRALRLYLDNNLNQSLKLFITTIKKDFALWKAYLRIFQVLKAKILNKQ